MDEGFDNDLKPAIYDIAIMDDVDFQLNMFSDSRLDLNKLYIGEFCTAAVHEFEALSVEAFQVIITRPDYMYHNHRSNDDDPFLFFCIDTNL